MRIIYLFIFSVLSIINTYGQTINLSAVADNTIYQDQTNNSNGLGENFTVGRTAGNAGNSFRRALIKFDFTSIPTGAIINSVSLRLVLNKTNSGASNVSLHRLNQNWGEGASDAGAGADGLGATATNGDATWLCSFANGVGGCTIPWTVAGGNFQGIASATTSVNTTGAYTWGTTSQMVTDVQNWYNNAASNFGWIIRGNEVTIGSAQRFSSRSNSLLSSQPVLTVTYSVTVPVTLTYFKAQETNYGNLLRWQTAQEINNAFFHIEHSTDGIQFKKLGTLNGRGNSAIATDYQFMHYDYAVGKNYYRLIQTDFNGRLTYSQIIIVSNSKSPIELLINPNPVRESINLKTTSFNGLQYRVFDFSGRPVMADILTGSNILLHDQLRAGNYYLRIYKKDGSAVSGSFLRL